MSKKIQDEIVEKFRKNRTIHEKATKKLKKAVTVAEYETAEKIALQSNMGIWYILRQLLDVKDIMANGRRLL